MSTSVQCCHCHWWWPICSWGPCWRSWTQAKPPITELPWLEALIVVVEPAPAMNHFHDSQGRNHHWFRISLPFFPGMEGWRPLKGKSILQTGRQAGQKWMQWGGAEISFVRAWSPRSCGLFIAREPGKLFDSGPSSCSVSLTPVFTWWIYGRIVYSLRHFLHLWKDLCQTSSPLENVLCLFQECPFHFLFPGLHNVLYLFLWT